MSIHRVRFLGGQKHFQNPDPGPERISPQTARGRRSVIRRDRVTVSSYPREMQTLFTVNIQIELKGITVYWNRIKGKIYIQ